MREVAITTIDNPYDPFTEFDKWFRYDTTRGYNTCAYLGRIAMTSKSLSDEENAKAIEEAIDEIIKFDFLDIYKKVSRETKDEEEDTTED